MSRMICTDYARSKRFCTEVLGLRVFAEIHRVEHLSHKLDLVLPNDNRIEIFSFPAPRSAPRAARPDVCSLRHLAFAVGDLDTRVNTLTRRSVVVAPVGFDALNWSRFTLFADSDSLPPEFLPFRQGTP